MFRWDELAINPTTALQDSIGARCRAPAREHLCALALAWLALPVAAAPTLPAGVVVQGVYDGDWWDNAAGGNRRGAVYAAHLDTSLAADADTLFGWHGTRFYFRSFADNGASIGRRVGSAQGVNNWESGYAGAKLLEAWVDQSFLNQRLSLRCGLYDTTTEFDKNKSQVLFANSAQGMNAPMAMSGENGPSTYPATALALRGRYTFDEHWTAKLALVDGVAGNPADPAASDIHLRAADGAFVISELRYHRSDGRRVDVGYWRYSDAFDELNTHAPNGGPRRARGNQGLYLSGDAMLSASADDPLRGISVGARIAYAAAGFNQFEWFANVSLTDVGFWSLRPDDKVGVGLIYASASADYRQAQTAQNLVARPNEWVLEATWRAPLAAWISLQPDVQYVLNPAHADRHHSALVFGLRMEITTSFGGS